MKVHARSSLFRPPPIPLLSACTSQKPAVYLAPQVLQSVLAQYNVPPDSFARVCVVVDKLDKLPRWVLWCPGVY